MIDRIREFFTTQVMPSTQDDTQQRIRLAAAALMVEVMVIDRHLDVDEQRKIRRLLQQQFQLSEEELEQLLLLAREEVDSATSLFQFTRLINDHYDADSKASLIENLWHVAYADQTLDKHEEALIRRIAELIYVPHRDFIQAKQRALGKY
ncbi:MAG: TerB family tellurite resistance protein [Gammaproteobacteria bacterium]|nr:MAG: TerB family tellurite resistance protein [Gammaproteobacteria bacterium]